MLGQIIEAYEWIYKKKPVQTALATIPFIGMFLPLVILVGQYQAHKEEQARQASQEYNIQKAKLDEIDRGLRYLSEYVQAQKSRLKENEDLINALKAEQARLTPVVEADKKVVDAIFDLQLQRNKVHVWFERAIGFISGVVSSIVASIVIAAVVYIYKRRMPHK